MLAVDTNLLVYAHRREVVEHPQASQLLRELAEGSSAWAIPWPCIFEFFAIVTNRRIWRDRASTPEQAWAQIESWIASPSLRLLTETPGLPELLAGLLVRPRVRGGVVHDARIAAICLTHGVEALLTRDRDFSLFGELPTRNPL